MYSSFSHFWPDREKSISLAALRYVRGPVILSEWSSSSYYLTVYAVGEEHVRRAKCPPNSTSDNTVDAPQWIESVVLSQKPDVVDVFLETPFLRRGSQRTRAHARPRSYLDEIERHFHDCLQVQKSMCHLENARFHYADVRALVDPLVDPQQRRLQLLQSIEELLKLNDSFCQQAKRHVCRMRRTLQMFQVKDAFNLAYIREQAKIDRQMQHIPERELRDALQAYFETEFAETVTSAEDIEKALTAFEQGNDRPLRSIQLKLLDNWATPMDWYLVARMFRSYTARPGARAGARARKAIIYGGANHIDRFTDIFQKLGLSLVRQSEAAVSSTFSQCLSVQDFYPWFGVNRSTVPALKEGQQEKKERYSAALSLSTHGPPALSSSNAAVRKKPSSSVVSKRPSPNAVSKKRSSSVVRKKHVVGKRPSNVVGKRPSNVMGKRPSSTIQSQTRSSAAVVKNRSAKLSSTKSTSALRSLKPKFPKLSTVPATKKALKKRSAASRPATLLSRRVKR